MANTISATHYPPALPQHLSDHFNLKPVTGKPSDEEVKAIHAVIRAVDSLFGIQGLYDPDLSIALSQHLFDVQTTRYRSKYHWNIFPADIIYAPPTLPGHIPTLLEPIAGSPSDEQAKSVHAALRASESLISVPSMYDPDLSMNLSQHLFDIQLARYIQHTALCQNHNDPPPASKEHTRGVPQARTTSVSDAPNSSAVLSEVISDLNNHASTKTTTGVDSTQELTSTGSDQNTVFNAGIQAGSAATLQTQTEEVVQVVHDIKDALKCMTQVMIGTQINEARSKNCMESGSSPHIVMNQKGEFPQMDIQPHLRNVARTYLSWSGTESELAYCLQFYSIGSELFKAGDQPVINPGQSTAALELLQQHLRC